MDDAIEPLNAALAGRYRIDRQIGEGGMAMVYHARDLRHERGVALTRREIEPRLIARAKTQVATS